jgi:hypothetical protein
MFEAAIELQEAESSGDRDTFDGTGETRHLIPAIYIPPPVQVKRLLQRYADSHRGNYRNKNAQSGFKARAAARNHLPSSSSTCKLLGSSWGPACRSAQF